MPNLPDDPRVERFFFRLDEPLRGMPAPERTELHTELRQHLETLVAAQLELGASPEEAIASALSSFGDPANVGRKLMREWRLKNRDPFWVTVAVLGACQFVVSWAVFLWFAPLSHFWKVERGTSIQITHFSNTISPFIPLLGGIVAGYRLPHRAVSGAFFVGMIASILNWLFFTIEFRHTWDMPSFGVSGMECLAAYIVSSMKRRDWTLHLQ